MNLLTVGEVAASLRVHPETVRTWARDGVLRGSKVGTAWRFHKVDVEAYLAGGLNVDYFAEPVTAS